MLDIRHGDDFALTNGCDGLPHLDAVHGHLFAGVYAGSGKLVLGGHIRDQRIGPAVDRNLIALGQVCKRHHDVVFGVDSQGSVRYCLAVIHGYGLCYRAMRAPVPRITWVTYFKVTMVVSPGVVIANAPCAAPHSTAHCGPCPAKKP